MLKLAGMGGDDLTLGAAIRAWYEADFKTSHGYEVMESQLFGPGWLDSGTYLYTNAVRCRTEDNAVPSTEMKASCGTWTRMLLDRPSVKGVVFIGRLAVEQVLGSDDDKLPAMTLKKQAKTGLLLLAVPHYSCLTSFDEKEAEAMVKRLVEAIR
jgi:uracil-DNA glycosylase